MPKSECPDFWIRLPRHKWLKSWSNIEDPVLLDRKLYGHPLAGLLWEREFGEILLGPGWEKVPNRECLFVHRNQGLFLSVYDDIKIGRKMQNKAPVWEKLMKLVDLGEPTSFLDHVKNWDVLNVNVKRTKVLLTNKKKCWNHDFLQQQLKSYQGWRNFTQRLSRGPATWKDILKSALRDIVNWQNKKETKTLLKVSTPCLDDRNFKKEEFGTVGELSDVCSQIVLNCLYVARISGPDILWSVKHLARTVTLSSFDFLHSSHK